MTLQGVAKLQIVPTGEKRKEIRLHTGERRDSKGRGWSIERVVVADTVLDQRQYKLDASDWSTVKLDDLDRPSSADAEEAIKRLRKEVEASDQGHLKIALQESVFQIDPPENAESDQVRRYNQEEGDRFMQAPKFKPFTIEVHYSVQHPGAGVRFVHAEAYGDNKFECKCRSPI